MSYGLEWAPAGAPLALVVVLCLPQLALIALGVVMIAALAALFVLAGAIAATPYLLFHSVRRRRAQNDADRRGAEPTSRALKPVYSEGVRSSQ